MDQLSRNLGETIKGVIMTVIFLCIVYVIVWSTFFEHSKPVAPVHGGGPYVVGTSDPYGLDGDNDGVGCENGGGLVPGSAPGDLNCGG